MAEQLDEEPMIGDPAIGYHPCKITDENVRTFTFIWYITIGAFGLGFVAYLLLHR